MSPGRPGPNRFSAVPEADASPGVLRLHDAGGSLIADVPFRPAGGAEASAVLVADVGDIGVGVWRATVSADGGSPVADFPFVMGAAGVTAGRAVPPVDPGLLIGLAMLLAGVFAVVYARSGGTLPRTDPAVSRLAMTAGGLAAAVAGLLVVALGPQV